MSPRSVIAELIAAGQRLATPKLFLDEALRQSARLIAFDSAILLPRQPAEPGTLNKFPGHAAIYQRYREREAAYLAELRRTRPVLAHDSAYLDVELFSAVERGRLEFFNEILRPQGITQRIVGDVSFHGRPLATMQLCRHGRSQRYSAREIDHARRLLPAIGLAHAALLSSAERRPEPKDGSPLERLSARELEIARYVRHGYRSREIAALLGTSPLTVRNQLSAIFTKLDLTSRAELAAFIAVTDRDP